MARKSFEELRATGALPSPPGVGMEILRITANENCSVDEISRVIQSDPALTGRLLQVANSALSGGARPCSTMKEATMRLGMRAVRDIALGFTLVSAHRAGACLAFDYGVFWSQSLARAVAAHVLSARFGVGAPAEAFIAALLSDLGSLALATVFPREYAEILAASQSRTTNGRATLEQERFGIDHREVTAAMLREWKLPDSFSTAAESLGAAKAPAPVPRRGASLAAVLWIAERFSSAFILPEDRPLDIEEVQAALRALPGGDPEQLAGLWSETAEGWRKWGRMLEIVTTAVPPFGAGVPARAKPGCPLFAAAPARAADHASGSSPQKPSAARTPAAVAPAPATAPAAAPRPAAKVEPAAGVALAETTARGNGARILVVDGDSNSLRILAAMLQRAGHEVTTAHTGKEALRIAMQVVPQILVADRSVPELDGIGLCRSLRAFEAGRRVYIILLTSDEAEDHIVEAFDAGVDDYVGKPFKAKILLARVRSGMRVVRMQERIDTDKQTQIRQVAELGVLNRRLTQTAVTDVLTDLPNRRFAMDAMREGWERAVREDEPLSVLMVDIDRFKRVNDTFGHNAGDTVLKETARVLRTQVEPPGVVCRLGGEEFVVVLPGAAVDAASEVAERLRAEIAAHEIHADGFDGHVTVSVGIATRDAAVHDSEHLLKLADEGLYRAKEAGRNRVCVARSSGAPAEPVAPIGG